MIFPLVRAGDVDESDDRSYRWWLVPIISGGENTSGVIRSCVLRGDRNRGIAGRGVVRQEATLVVVGRRLRFEVEVGWGWMERTEAIVCRVGRRGITI